MIRPFDWSGMVTNKFEAEPLAETPAVEDDPYVSRLHCTGDFLPGYWFLKQIHQKRITFKQFAVSRS